MTPNIYMNDFEGFPFFQNVVQTKLDEAQRHLKKLELYRAHPDLLNMTTLDEIVYIHEENSEFMIRVYAQCKVWREQPHLREQINKINYLETLTKTLETTTYHILYCVDQIQKKSMAAALPTESGHEQAEWIM